MKRELEMLQNHSSGSGLEDAERQALRDSLMSYMDRNPAKAPVALKARGIHSFGYVNTMLAVALVAVFAFGSVSYAAERAVPGDALYPMKRGVNEKVRGFFAVTDRSKAELEVSLASRRLDEAEKLQSESKLNGDVAAQLSTDLSAHVANIKAQEQHLSTMHDDQDAADTETKLQSSLNAHAAVIPALMAGRADILFAATSTKDTQDEDSHGHKDIVATSTSEHGTGETEVHIKNSTDHSIIRVDLR